MNYYIFHWLTALCTGGTYSGFLLCGLIDWTIPTSCHIKCVNNLINTMLDIWFCPVLNPPRKKRLIALHFSFNFALYVCSRNVCMTQLSTRRNQLEAHLISRHKWRRYTCMELYIQGTKLITQGWTPEVPWCNLWIKPIKCRCFSNKYCN